MMPTGQFMTGSIAPGKARHVQEADFQIHAPPLMDSATESGTPRSRAKYDCREYPKPSATTEHTSTHFISASSFFDYMVNHQGTVTFITSLSRSLLIS